MLRSLNKILGSSIVATDGEIGSVYNFLFDDVSWRVVYIVVMAGASFSKHKVLLSPSAVKQPDWNHKVLPVSLTSEARRSTRISRYPANRRSRCISTTVGRPIGKHQPNQERVYSPRANST
jgi:hypothetical protein